MTARVQSNVTGVTHSIECTFTRMVSDGSVDHSVDDLIDGT
ncbi:MAG: hypothetical protein ACLPN2_07290 [Terriglobales bacterium]